MTDRDRGQGVGRQTRGRSALDLAELGAKVAEARHEAECQLIASILSEPKRGLRIARDSRTDIAMFEGERWRLCYAAVEAVADAGYLYGTALEQQEVVARLIRRAVEQKIWPGLDVWGWDTDDSSTELDQAKLYYALRDGDQWSDSMLCRLFDCYPSASMTPLLVKSLGVLYAATRDAREHWRRARELMEAALSPMRGVA